MRVLSRPNLVRLTISIILTLKHETYAYISTPQLYSRSITPNTLTRHHTKLSLINEDFKPFSGRRNFLSSPLLIISTPAFAADDKYTKSGNGFSYSFLPPPGFKPSNKPLKTHLDEINFTKEGERGYQYGITVDPVRIQSLKEFGTPEVVAKRVVDAEQNRDGVTDVALYGTPFEDPVTGSYGIDYISKGSRGTKHFVTRIFIKNNRLYVLTAQVKEDGFAAKADEIANTVKTFFAEI